MRYLRQQDICPADVMRDLHVTVVGCGAVGSFTALALAKMGVGSMTLYDPDKVEEHNLPVQFFANLDLGKHKVDALANQLVAMTETRITAIPEAFDGQPVHGIVVSAVDTMNARRRIWDHVRVNSQVALYTDTRMGAMVGQVLTVRPGSPVEGKTYARTLHRQSEALEEPCTARAVIFTVLGIASTTTGIVRSFVAGEAVPQEVVQDFRLGVVLINGRVAA